MTERILIVARNLENANRFINKHNLDRNIFIPLSPGQQIRGILYNQYCIVDDLFIEPVYKNIDEFLQALKYLKR